MTIRGKGEAMAERVTLLYGGKDPRALPSHSLSEAAAYLRVPRSTLHAWLLGMGTFKPVLCCGSPLAADSLVFQPGRGARPELHPRVPPSAGDSTGTAVRGARPES